MFDDLWTSLLMSMLKKFISLWVRKYIISWGSRVFMLFIKFTCLTSALEFSRDLLFCQEAHKNVVIDYFKHASRNPWFRKLDDFVECIVCLFTKGDNLKKLTKIFWRVSSQTEDLQPRVCWHVDMIVTSRNKQPSTFWITKSLHRMYREFESGFHFAWGLLLYTSRGHLWFVFLQSHRDRWGLFWDTLCQSLL